MIGLSFEFHAVGSTRAPFRHARGNLGEIARTLRGGGFAAAQRGREVFQRQTRVAGERQLGARGAADLGGLDLDMDHRLARRNELEALGRDFAQLAADNDEAIRCRDHRVGDAVVTTEQSGGERMRAGNGALARHGVRDGNALPFGQLQQRLIGLRDVDAAAGEDQRALGVADQGRRLVDTLGGRARAAGLRLQRLRVDPEIAHVEIELAMRDILGHIDQHRAGPSAGGDGEGAAHMLGDALADFDADQLLHHRAQDLELARLLRHVLPGVLAIGVAGDGDHRNAGVQALNEARHEIGGAWPQRRIDHAGAVRHLGVGIGREGAAALVVDQRVLQSQRPAGLVER